MQDCCPVAGTMISFANDLLCYRNHSAQKYLSTIRPKKRDTPWEMRWLLIIPMSPRIIDLKKACSPKGEESTKYPMQRCSSQEKRKDRAGHT